VTISPSKILRAARSLCPTLTLLAISPQARAQGTITFVTPPQPFYYAAGVDVSHNLDLNNDGLTDLILASDAMRAYFAPQGNNSVVVAPDGFVVPLNRGDVVSSSPSSLDPTYAWLDSTIPTTGFATLGAQAVFDGQFIYTGYWSGQDAFVGLRFQYSGQTHYGWMEIANNTGTASGQVLGWAYETRPDTPILAGAVPEPSCISLCLLGILLMFTRRPQSRFRL
jgi:hypothetical protein